MNELVVPRAEDCFLVVVDVQPGLLHAYPQERAARVVEGVVFALQTLTRLGMPSLLLELEPEKLGPAHPDVLMASSGAAVLSKLSYDATREESFREAVRGTGRRTAVLLGVEAHVCVLQTAAGLKDLGYRVCYLADAVASREALDEDVGRKLLERAGAEALCTEALLFASLGSGHHPRFPEILPVLKDRVRRQS